MPYSQGVYNCEGVALQNLREGCGTGRERGKAVFTIKQCQAGVATGWMSGLAISDRSHAQITLHQIIIQICNWPGSDHTAFFHNKKIIRHAARERQFLFDEQYGQP